ncbi:hypothetical protein V3C99_003205, partial [Haemonchus contortus]
CFFAALRDNRVL